MPGKQDGDRTIEQQMKGLDRALLEMDGAKVLDLGCAEGLVGLECAKRNAKVVYGFEVVDEHVHVANTLHANLHAVCLDLNDKAGVRSELAKVGKVHVCLMLAILHKLREPGHVVDKVLDINSPEVIVIRTAERSPGFVYDERSNFKKYEFQPRLAKAGYTMEHTCFGPKNEWMGYFRKG